MSVKFVEPDHHSEFDALITEYMTMESLCHITIRSTLFARIPTDWRRFHGHLGQLYLYCSSLVLFPSRRPRRARKINLLVLWTRINPDTIDTHDWNSSLEGFERLDVHERLCKYSIIGQLSPTYQSLVWTLEMYKSRKRAFRKEIFSRTRMDSIMSTIRGQIDLAFITGSRDLDYN